MASQIPVPPPEKFFVAFVIQGDDVFRITSDSHRSHLRKFRRTGFSGRGQAARRRRAGATHSNPQRAS